MYSSRTSTRDDDAGFTLVEVIVALTLVALIAAALVPLLIAAARSDQLTKQQTQAKSLSISRLAAMRDLPFHVAYQNGAYIDVLDEYYTNASTTANSVAATGGSGRYATGTVPGQSASTAYYRVDFASSALSTGFTQTVYSQFLAAATKTNTVKGVIAPAASYNTQDTAGSGADQPPSLLLGVTVVTTFGGTHSYRVYTEISDAGHDAPLVLAQAGATAITVDSHAADGSLVSAVAAQVGLDATLSNTSSASATALGGRFSRDDSAGTTTYADVVGATASVASPPVPSSAAAQSSGAVTAGSGSCGWGRLGPSGTSTVSATVANAQPRAPMDVETGSPAPTVSSFVTANGNGSCNAFEYSNLLSGSVNPALGLATSLPQVLIADAPGNSKLLTSTANLDTPALGSGNPVKAVATTALAGRVQVFPGMSFITDATYGRALVVVQLTAGSITCTANTSTATASYSGSVLVWTQTSAASPGAYTSIPFNWTSGNPPTLPALTTTVTYVNGAPVPLSTWLQSWQFNGVVQQAPLTGTSSVGSHTIPAAVTIDTQPTLLSSVTSLPDPGSDLAVNVGRLSCVSEDIR